MKNISPYAKAIAGFVASGLTAYLGVADNGVNGDEWVKVVIAAVLGSGLIYAVPNKDPKALHQDESVQPPQRGAADLVTVLVIVLLVVLILVLLGVFR